MSSSEHPLLRGKLLTRAEAAEYLGVSLGHVGRLIRTGVLPAFAIGRRRLIDPGVLRTWLNAGATSREVSNPDRTGQGHQLYGASPGVRTRGGENANV